MNFEPEVDAESLFKAAQNTLGENDFDDSKAYLESQQGKNNKERLILYLKALQNEPLVADEDALRLVKSLARSTNNERDEDFGVDVEFKASDKLMPEKTVRLEHLRDLILRVELANLIDRLELLPDH